MGVCGSGRDPDPENGPQNSLIFPLYNFPIILRGPINLGNLSPKILFFAFYSFLVILRGVPIFTIEI